LQYDYLALGHVTADVLEDGSTVPGGSVLYGALQASRLGLRSLIVTAGVPDELERLLEPFRDELDVQVMSAPETTRLQTRGFGEQRRQRLTRWAGPIEASEQPSARILHLAPVARELPAAWDGAREFCGLTPQGLVRHWPKPDREIELGAPDAQALAHAAGSDALVISSHERDACGPLLDRALESGALVAVTAGERPGTMLLGSGRTLATPVVALEAPVEDLGAGDVYAAALFVALVEGREPHDAAAFAGAAAAVRMMGRGAGAIGDRSAIERRLSGRAP
jgi:sugar/nucleoside kinase (ribokinase family)